MKKLSLLVGGLVLSTVAMAQKPMASDAAVTLEGQLGWVNTSEVGFTAPSVRARYFVADNIAVRLTLGMNNNSTSDIVYQNADNTGATGTIETSNNMWSLGIGGEYHFTGTDKLSPYVGLDILLGGSKTTTDETNVDAFGNYSTTDMYSEERPSSMFGVNLVAGTDYYFAENFYLGFEMGLGWQSWTDKEGSYSSTVGTTSASGVTNGESKNSFLGNNAIGMFRLGWRF